MHGDPSGALTLYHAIFSTDRLELGRRHRIQRIRQHARLLFDQLDRNHDGELSSRELKGPHGSTLEKQKRPAQGQRGNGGGYTGFALLDSIGGGA
jgi:hypothetical protein